MLRTYQSQGQTSQSHASSQFYGSLTSSFGTTEVTLADVLQASVNTNNQYKQTSKLATVVANADWLSCNSIKLEEATAACNTAYTTEVAHQSHAHGYCS